jgi:Na+-driven multidrug efflux pump
LLYSQEARENAIKNIRLFVKILLGISMILGMIGLVLPYAMPNRLSTIIIDEQDPAYLESTKRFLKVQGVVSLVDSVVNPLTAFFEAMFYNRFLMVTVTVCDLVINTACAAIANYVFEAEPDRVYAAANIGTVTMMMVLIAYFIVVFRNLERNNQMAPELAHAHSISIRMSHGSVSMFGRRITTTSLQATEVHVSTSMNPSE